MRSALAVVEGHAEDVWGIALVTVGVLGVLALYADALGPAGNGVRAGTGVLLGVGRFLVPPACGVAGAMLVAGRPRHDPARTALGFVLALAAVAGLSGLAGGAPRITATTTRLDNAGGWIGAAMGNPLRAGLGDWGAAVVLVALATLALVLFTGVTVREACRSVGRAAAGLWHLAVPDEDDLEDADEIEEDDDVTAVGGVPAQHASGAVLPDVVEEPAGRGRARGAGSRQLFDIDALLGSASGAAVPDPNAEHDGDALAEVPRAVAPEAAPEPEPVIDAVVPTPVPAPPEPLLRMEAEAAVGEWRLPPRKLLSRSKPQELDRSEVAAAGRALVASLAAHGVETRLVGYTVGPTVTRFELELGPGVKVARVTSLAKDIAYAMASPDVRILAPIPGKSAIGVEVPNRRRQLVTLGDVLASDEARKAVHPLEVALGRDIAGRPVMANLADMPHILISGATGAGKSSCINSVLTSILMRATPEEVRLILVDPKRVELGQYNGLPHLLTQVVVDPKKAANALSWAVTEMERRYDVLAEAGMRDITGYNAAIDRGEFDDDEPGAAHGDGLHGTGSELSDAPRVHDDDAEDDVAPEGSAHDDGPFDVTAAEDDAVGEASAEEHGDDLAGDLSAELAGDGPAAASAAARVAESRAALAPEVRKERLPFVLVVVDELNDLMMVAARDVEESVCRIAQMARAVGIHLVLATQRPSVDVITGVIKANVPSRLAFSVSSLADSRVILDQPGAERLIGKGDMLLLTASSSVPRRIQGPWVAETEVRAVVAHWQRQRNVEYVAGIAGDDGPTMGGDALDDDDDLLPAAMELVVRSQLGSTSMLQRKLRVGFSRAGRLMDLLERRGVVGPSEGSKARAVLMTIDELEQLSVR
jgi:S-DNA-T family DNA segregation ATPase FtsK/SpoIIIE